MAVRERAARRLAPVRHRIRRPAPTSAEGVAFVAALGYSGARVATVLQMIPALPTGLALSPEPHLYAVLWVAAAVAATGVAVACTFVIRGPLGPKAAAADVALAVVFLLLGVLTVPAEDRVGSWVGWEPGYTLAVVLSLAGLRMAAWLSAVGVLTAAYLFFVVDSATAGNRTTIASDTLSLLVFGAVARVVVRYVTKVAADADAARAQVAELARLEEEHRARLTMHDAATIMQLLADATVPPATQDQLREQAVAEVRRMRAYLSGGGGPVRQGSVKTGTVELADGRVLLCDVLQTAMTGFADLGLEPALDLADRVTVGTAEGEAVRGAVAGALHNVRRHARASMVVVHADAEPEAGRWVVTVRDDGVGFDPAGVRFGTGLRRQVLGETRRHGLVARIASAPGLGTRITIEGKLRG
jgi:signal transduction histidine kinase